MRGDVLQSLSMCRVTAVIGSLGNNKSQTLVVRPESFLPGARCQTTVVRRPRPWCSRACAEISCQTAFFWYVYFKRKIDSYFCINGLSRLAWLSAQAPPWVGKFRARTRGKVNNTLNCGTVNENCIRHLEQFRILRRISFSGCVSNKNDNAA